MKKSLLQILVCPLCGCGLEMTDEGEVRKEEIIHGVLRCAGDHSFAIREGVPVLLLEDKYRDKQRQVMESFIYNRAYADSPPYEKFMKKWFLKKYGWKTCSNFAKFLGYKKFILDAGCGYGRDVKTLASLTSRGVVIGVDLSGMVFHAYKNIGGLPNVHFIQADIFSLPFKEGFFDFIHSEGVLHHTSDTRKALEKLLRHLSSGGEIEFYVYRKKNPLREFCDDYVRSFTRKLKPQDCWKVAKAFTEFGRVLSKLNVNINVPMEIPYLDIKKGKHNLHTLFYYNLFKCFWNEKLPYELNVLVNFDWYHPEYAWRHTPEEVKNWLKQFGLETTWFHVERSGISVRAKKLRRSAF